MTERESPADTYRRVALASLDACEAANQYGPLAGTETLTGMLRDYGDEIDVAAMLSVATVAVFICGLAEGVTAREVLDTLYRACA